MEDTYTCNSGRSNTCQYATPRKRDERRRLALELPQALVAEESLEGEVISILGMHPSKIRQALPDAIGYHRDQPGRCMAITNCQAFPPLARHRPGLGKALLRRQAPGKRNVA